MPIPVGQAIRRTSADPIDETLVLSKADMLAINDDLMPPRYFCVCKDDGKLYIYDKTATPSAETGKFTMLQQGGGNGSGSNLPMTQDVLWDWDGTAGSGLPTAVGSIITFENPLTDYDLILFEIGNNPTTDASEWKTSAIYTVEEIKEAFGEDVRFYVGMSGYNWSLKFTDATHATLGAYDESNHTWRRVTGIRFGSSLDGTIGRWEKIGEWTTTTVDIPLDLSPYQVLALTSYGGENNKEKRNTAIIRMEDFTVDTELESHIIADVYVYFKNLGNGLYKFGNARTGGGILYGYRETAISDADVQRIAAQVRPFPDGGTTGQALVKVSDADGDADWGDVRIDVDNAISASSENPVQNKVISAALADKQDVLTAGTGAKIENNVISFNYVTAGRKAVAYAGTYSKSGSYGPRATYNQTEYIDISVMQFADLSDYSVEVSGNYTLYISESETSKSFSFGKSVTWADSTKSYIITVTLTKELNRIAITTYGSGIGNANYPDATFDYSFVYKVYYTGQAAGGSGLPAGGTTGQALVKRTNADGDVQWADAGGGGTVDQTYDATSANAQSGVAVGEALAAKQNLITGGTQGQVLAKNSGTAGDIGWYDVEEAFSNNSKYVAGNYVSAINFTNGTSSAGIHLGQFESRVYKVFHTEEGTAKETLCYVDKYNTQTSTYPNTFRFKDTDTYGAGYTFDLQYNYVRYQNPQPPPTFIEQHTYTASDTTVTKIEIYEATVTELIRTLPKGGTQGQVLVKQSGIDGDAAWETQTGGGSGGTSYDDTQVLARISALEQQKATGYFETQATSITLNTVGYPSYGTVGDTFEIVIDNHKPYRHTFTNADIQALRTYDANNGKIFYTENEDGETIYVTMKGTLPDNVQYIDGSTNPVVSLSGATVTLTRITSVRQIDETLIPKSSNEVFIFDVDTDQFTPDPNNVGGKHYGMELTSPTFDDIMEALLSGKLVFARLTSNSGDLFDYVQLYRTYSGGIDGRYFDLEFPQKNIMYVGAYIQKRNYGQKTYFGVYSDTVSTSGSGSSSGGGDVNVIEEVQVNGTALTPDANKAVNVVVPTVDQTYGATSTNAQSGTAVAQAVANKVDNTQTATDTALGLVKTNPSESVTVDADGKLKVGGRIGQFSGTTGLFAPTDREPRQVKDYSFLMTDAKGVNMKANRSFAIVSGYGLACKSAAAGTTQYQLTNNYQNRIIAKMCEGGYASRDEATSTVQQIVPVVSVTINGSAFTPDSSSNDSSAPIVITTQETLNPDAAITNIRLFGSMASYATAHIGNGVKTESGGRSLMIGGGITKVDSGNDICVVGNAMYTKGNGNALFGRNHISMKNRWFMAGTGHDNTNGITEAGAVFGQYADIQSDTAFAVGNGTSQTERSNLFEVKTNGDIYVNGTKLNLS